jgi:Holliday junction resolvase
LASKAYKKGYSLERYAQLTLEYNGWHVKRNAMSIGIEDLIAFKDGYGVLLIQCKNTKRGEKSMSKDEQAILKHHAMDLGGIPVYLYKDGRNQYVWLDLNYNLRLDEALKTFTKEWYRERMGMRAKLRTMKKKNLAEYNRYVIKNWKEVEKYIC